MPEPARAARSLIFLDTEFTHLNPDLAQVVDVAYAAGDGPIVSGIPPHDLDHADPKALEVNRYHERDLGNRAKWDRDIIDDLARDTAGQSIVAANPRVDAAVLAKLIGYESWHYRLVDLESVAFLLLGFDQQPGLRDIRNKLAELGFELPPPNHTAEGDVLTGRACFRAMQRIAQWMLRAGLPTAAELDEHELAGTVG